MPRNVAAQVENSFVNGLITEATALNFPESAVIDGFNVIHDNIGRIIRRQGFDFETGYVTHSYNRASVVVNTYLWQNAAGDGNNTFVVLQMGSTLYFYRVGAAGALSAGRMAGTISLSTFSPGSAPSPSTVECRFAYGNGYLFVVHPYLDPFYVSYNETTQAFTATKISLKIRDTLGVDESVEADNRPAVLTDTHKYNLLNQGWTTSKITTFKSAVGTYPSNADVWWLFKNADDSFDPRTTKTNVDRGNTPAPKGHYVLDALNQNRSSYVGSIPLVSAGFERPSAVEFYAGRVWYAGVSADGFNGKIYFSQVIEKAAQFGLCHQLNDPTSETLFDLLPTDGGYISILEMGNLIKMVVIDNMLMVFATNGVWTISGSTGLGFAANDYTVKRVSATPALSANNFINVSGIPSWWNADGIYTVQFNQTLQTVEVISMSEKKIKKLFKDIPAESKKYAKGYFNSLTKTVLWLYRSSAPLTVTAQYEFDRALVFNANTGAFYQYSFDNGNVRLNGVIAAEGIGSSDITVPVTDNLGNVVTDNLGAPVTARGETAVTLASVFKFVVSYPFSGQYNLTFAEEYSNDYRDWKSYDGVGVDYSSYVIGGYKVHGDAQRKFQGNYIYVYCDNTTNNQVDIQGLWDFASTGNTGRWSSKQRVTTVAGDYRYKKKRLSIRGQGLALQIRFSSVSGQPFNVVGWSLWETGNAGI